MPQMRPFTPQIMRREYPEGKKGWGFSSATTSSADLGLRQTVLTSTEPERRKHKMATHGMELSPIERSKRRSLVDLNLPERLLQFLDSEGLKTVGDLTQKSSRDLLRLPGIGSKSVKDIESALSKVGLKLSEDRAGRLVPRNIKQIVRPGANPSTP
jgi:DNA-directed RNA polymerase alpha subunit